MHLNYAQCPMTSFSLHYEDKNVGLGVLHPPRLSRENALGASDRQHSLNGDLDTSLLVNNRVQCRL